MSGARFSKEDLKGDSECKCIAKKILTELILSGKLCEVMSK